jgi:hypothetical protein
VDAFDAKHAGVVAHADDASVERHEPGVGLGAERGIDGGEGQRVQVDGVHGNVRETTIHKKCHDRNARPTRGHGRISRLKYDVLPDEAAFSAGILRG